MSNDKTKQTDTGSQNNHVGMVLAGKKGRRWTQKLMVFAREQPLGVMGGVLFLLVVVVAICAPVLAHQDIASTDMSRIFRPPSAENWFGTDQLGRDVWSRWVYGARLSLMVGLTAVVVASVLGGLIGIASALIGGKFDLIIQRVFDAWLAMPAIVLAIVIMAALGTSVVNVIIAISTVAFPRINRLTRSTAMSLKESLYVESAKIDGASTWRIIVHHIAPNCLAPWMVYSTALLGNMILAEATLSFLGLGIPAPAASWGRDISENINNLYMAPWLAIFPGIGLCLAVFAANFIGDSVRDLVDPRLKKV
jgi:peptide/nickel transport system permease protein